MSISRLFLGVVSYKTSFLVSFQALSPKTEQQTAAACRTSFAVAELFVAGEFVCCFDLVQKHAKTEDMPSAVEKHGT